MDVSATGNQARTELPGHSHVPLDGENQTGLTNPDAELQVTLVLRRQSELPELHSEFGNKLPHERRHLTRSGASLTNISWRCAQLQFTSEP